MTKEMIILELRNRGYEVRENAVEKNNVILDGFSILEKNCNISPQFYSKPIIELAEKNDYSVEHVADEIIRLYKENVPTQDFDTESIFETDYILNHIRVGVQRASKDNLIKDETEFEGIERYLYISDKSPCFDGAFTIRLKPEMLEYINIDEEILWKTGMENTFKDTCIRSLNEVLGLDMEMQDLYILSNKDCKNGASAILDREFIRNFGEQMNISKFVILPSSIHECLLFPYTDDIKENIDFFTTMVKEVNTAEVEPIEQLSDRAYFINIHSIEPILK